MDKMYGPYQRKDGRWIVVFGKKTISYPKWLYEQHHKVKLTDQETIDHIDNNPNNNDISNLQVLSRADNARKSVRRATMSTLICPVCKKEFTRRTAVVQYNKNIRKNAGPYCSHSCSSTIHH